MPSICLCFQSHQPYRLRPYSFFDIGNTHIYDDEEGNHKIIDRVAARCYVPANLILMELINQYEGDFRIAFSLTGVFLEQMEMYRPDVIESFQKLAATGCVEFLGETYYHSLAFLFSNREFKEQAAVQFKKIRELFGQEPVTFQYTELVYSNELAQLAEEMGYQNILAGGTEKILGRRSSNFVYRPVGLGKLKLLLKNCRLSDDIALRFGDPQWTEHPLRADKFASWLQQLREGSEVVNLFMDYETFGEHKRQETGIFDFLRALPQEIIGQAAFRFQKPAEAALAYAPAVQLDVPDITSRADRDSDLTDWLGNGMQQDAIKSLYGLEDAVRSRKDPALLHTWRKLQASDHFHYMCTGHHAGGSLPVPFSPYESPYDAYINYMNIMDDFSRRLGTGVHKSRKKK